MSTRTQPRAGTIVIRNGVIVYASEGAAALSGRRIEEGIGRPYSEFIVEEQRSVVQDRYDRRTRGETVPTTYEVTLLLPDGRRRAVEVHVEQDGMDSLVHLRDVSGQETRRLRLDSLATLGAAIQHERTEEGIHCRAREELSQLGISSAFLGKETEGVRILWASVPEPFSSGFLTAAGTAFDGSLLPFNAFLHRLCEEGAAFAEDFALEVSRSMPEELAGEVRRLVGAAEMGRAAAVRVENRSEVQTCLLIAGDWLRPDDLPAVRLFGAQLAAALDAARTISDLYGRNADLATLNRVADLAADAPDLDTFFSRAGEVLRYSLDCRWVSVYVLDEEATSLRQVYEHGVRRDSVQGGRRAPLDGPLGDAVRQRSAQVMTASSHPGIGFRTLVKIPLVVRSRTIGVLTAGFDLPEERVRERLELLTALTSHFAGVLESHTLLGRLRRRLSDLEAVNALAEGIFANAPGDVPALLRDGCREAARALSCYAAVLYLAEDGGTSLRAAAAWGIDIDSQSPLPLRLEDDALPAEAMRRRAPVSAEDVTRRPHGSAQGGQEASRAAGLAVPVTSRDAARGVLLLSDTAGRSFTEADVALASALAGELAVGLENAELYEDLRRSYADLARAQQQVIQGERLAALGELSAVVAHEVRNPLGVIFNSLGSLRRLLQPTGDAKMLLDMVGEEADRLNRIVGDLLDFARPSTPQVRDEMLERVVEEAVVAALAQQPFAIEVDRDLDTAAPLVPLDARLVRQAVLNVAVNAVQAMPRGGRISVRTRHDADGALVEIEDSGPGIPDELKERIFEPFFTTKASGTGLGLAVVKRIVEGHGGSVAVRSARSSGTVFVLRFPPAAGSSVEKVKAMG